ncbi:peptidoglycan-binding protein [Clostridium sp. DL1XJH146]
MIFFIFVFFTLSIFISCQKTNSPLNSANNPTETLETITISSESNNTKNTISKNIINTQKSIEESSPEVDKEIVQEKILLTLNSTGNEVLSLQKSLYNIGFDLNIDGIYGGQTTSIIKELQKNNSLLQSGNYNEETKDILDTIKCVRDYEEILKEKEAELAKTAADAKAEADAQAKAEADAKAQANAQVKAEADSKAQADAQVKAEADAKAQADAQVKAEADAKAQADAQAKAEADAKAQADAQAKAEADAKTQADAQAKAEADAKAQADAQAKVEAAENNTLASIPDINTNPGNSEQVLVVLADSYGTLQSTYTAYEKVSGNWKVVYSGKSVVGKNGFNDNRTQGDKTTPTGKYGFPFMFGTASNPGVKFTYKVATTGDYWASNTILEEYNIWLHYDGDDPVERMYDFESLWKQPLYKYAAVIDFNYYGNKQLGKGSGIFLHLWRQGTSGTAGCVAMSETDLLQVMKWMDPAKNPCIIMGVKGHI